MLFAPEMLVPSGPPPQAVLDQRGLWRVLFALLSITFVLRLLALDVAGAILGGLMLCLAVLVTRDGMSELSKYALLYGTLCVLCFFFDIIPLLVSLGGRTQTTVHQINGMGSGDRHSSHKTTTYSIMTEKHAFINWSLGLKYNALSLAMITSPIGMILGAYLSLSAHNEFIRSIPAGDEEAEFFPPVRAPLAGRGIGALPGPPTGPSSGRGAYGATAYGGNIAQPGQAHGTPGHFEHFQGTGHKLGGD
eukprot:gnl/TRDRNA2_/TRDRNA2_60152_c0_seq1.p1 gnl/TRDRNA2_/TRDRNA2_60152_c0~~gnl/TRDRNA2_/TRDRNA2_60152_c0_seq1.p1  ORF type:complete len:248 (+),score=30.64 gnl/TRDRNA2_/TRDRNA2_60152_c0_seq1:182-925(+)